MKPVELVFNHWLTTTRPSNQRGDERNAVELRWLKTFKDGQLQQISTVEDAQSDRIGWPDLLIDIDDVNPKRNCSVCNSDGLLTEANTAQ